MDVNSLVQGNVDDVHSGADHQRASFILRQTRASEIWKDGFRTWWGGMGKPELVSVSCLLGQVIFLVILF